MESDFRSYDEVLQEFIEYRMAGDATAWAQAELAYYACNVMGCKARKFAADVGYSERYISDLRKTYSAFPGPEIRISELSFCHHSIAARTNDPHYWIAQAADRHLSTREMKKAVKGHTTPDELRRAEAVWAAVERTLALRGPGADWLMERIKEKAGG